MGGGGHTGGDQPSCMPPARLGFRGMPAKKVGLKVPDGAGRERVKHQPIYCTFLFLALIFAVDGFGFSGSLGMMEMGTLEFILGVFGWLKRWVNWVLAKGPPFEGDPLKQTKNATKTPPKVFQVPPASRGGWASWCSLRRKPLRHHRQRRRPRHAQRAAGATGQGQKPC